MYGPTEIKRRGKTYVWKTNVERGDFFYNLSSILKKQGLPILFEPKAYDCNGHSLPYLMAIYVLDEAQEEFNSAVHQIKAKPLNHVLETAYCMSQRSVISVMLKAGIPKDQRREILEFSKQRWASHDKRLIFVIKLSKLSRKKLLPDIVFRFVMRVYDLLYPSPYFAIEE